MDTYIDGFVFPLKKQYLDEYKSCAMQVVEIWKEHGALSYQEFIGDDMRLNGTASFEDLNNMQEDELVIFGWVSFPNKQIRDKANEAVRQDDRMPSIVNPLLNPERLIFDSKRMIYGGFQAFIP